MRKPATREEWLAKEAYLILQLICPMPKTWPTPYASLTPQPLNPELDSQPRCHMQLVIFSLSPPCTCWKILRGSEKNYTLCTAAHFVAARRKTAAPLSCNILAAEEGKEAAVPANIGCAPYSNGQQQVGLMLNSHVGFVVEN